MKSKRPVYHFFWRLRAFFLLSIACMNFQISRGMSDEPLPPPNVHVGEKAPDFALRSGDNKTVKLSDFAGHNVLIDFYRGYW